MKHTPSSTATDCQLADTAKALDHVYRLRYECYHRSGAIPANASERFSDSFDAEPNHFSFLASNEEQGPVGTVRISVAKHEAGWTTSPGAHVFGDHPAFQEIARASYVEASRLCFRPQARRDVLCRLVAHMAALAEYHETEWLVACPRVEHAGIYQRVFSFHSVAAPRQYFGVNFQTELLAVSLAEMRALAGGVKSMKNAWAEARELVARTVPVAA